MNYTQLVRYLKIILDDYKKAKENGFEIISSLLMLEVKRINLVLLDMDRKIPRIT